MCEIDQKRWEKWRDSILQSLGTILSKNNSGGYFLNNFQEEDSLAIGVTLGDI